MTRNSVFNIRRSRLLRTRIPLAENLTSIAIACALSGLIIWVLAQRDAFDPEARDLSPALLVRSGAPIEIYNPPLTPWVEPGQPPISSDPNLGALPLSILDEQWRPVVRARRFDADNLYEKINGEAEKFLKQGFVSLDYVVLRSAEDGSEIAIELYDQGSVGGSMGVFSAHVSDDRVLEEEAGVTYFMTSAGVIGRKDRFFFRVAGDRQTREVTEKSARLVLAFEGLAGSSDIDTPEGLGLLTQAMGIQEQNVSFQKTNVFQFDFAKDFWFGGLEEDEAARVFLHVADSEADASALLEAIVEEQKADYQVVVANDTWTTLKHTFLATYFSIGQQGRYLFGADNLSNRGGIQPTMEGFKEHLGLE